MGGRHHSDHDNVGKLAQLAGDRPESDDDGHSTPLLRFRPGLSVRQVSHGQSHLGIREGILNLRN